MLLKDLIAADTALFDRPARVVAPFFDLFKVEGADACSWLQGQVTNDVSRLEIGQACQACLCQATGQISAMMHVCRQTQGFLLAIQKSGSEAFQDRVSRFVIMEDVEVAPIHEAIEFIVGAVDGDGNVACAITHWGQNCTLFGFETELERVEWVRKHNLPDLEFDATRRLDLYFGEPRFGYDTDDRTMPAELGEAFLNRYVSFDKGCYVGQEVVMRIHSRGRVHRHWVGLWTPKAMSAGSVVQIDNAKVGETSEPFVAPSGFATSAFVSEASAPAHSEVEVVCATGEALATIEPIPLAG